MKASDCYLDFWHVSAPKRARFDIATREGREARSGWVVGDFAVHREKGFKSWTLTHRPTGLAIWTGSAPISHRAEALMWVSLAAGGHLSDSLKAAIAEYAAKGWAGGLAQSSEAHS